MTRKLTLSAIIVFIIVGMSTSYLFYSNNIHLEDIQLYIGDNLTIVAIVFLLFYTFRIYIFIPSTVIIIALGVITQNILFTFVVSMIGVGIGLIETYFIGYYLNKGLDGHKLLHKIEPHVVKIKERGFRYILVGCFFPAFPTDLICYATGFIKYNFKKFLLAGMIGEFSLVLLYSYLGIQAEKYVSHLAIIGLILLIVYLGYIFYIKSKKIYK